MSRRKMFLRMVTASLLRRRSRMLIALLSIGIGATILCGLLTIYYDVPRQMGAQFRSYGANVILLSDGSAPLTHSSVRDAMQAFPQEDIVGATPYRYVRMDMVSRQQSFTTAGTDFTQVQKTSPYFSVEGAYPENLREVLVGKEIAELIGVRLNSVMELTYKPAENAALADPSLSWTPGASLAGSAEGWGGGLVNVTAALDGEGKIASVSVDAATQTKEIGGQCEEEAFTSQFIGKTLPLSDVDAISGATLTSHAVMSALNTSVRADAAANQAKTSSFRVVGILTTGGEEEGYLFISEADMA
ncbi:MAG: FMN-binding protein, partial [Clostridia bacterium]|nr:FMN-binding protein [Clostridia bacterium]